MIVRDNRAMEERLEEIERRYDQLAQEMSSPRVASDPTRLRELDRSFAELQEIVLPFRKYKATAGEVDEARALAAQETDPEAARYFREEAERAEAEATKLREELEMLLVPKDPNDARNVVLEIRAGPGGQEAMLWAGDLLEMYRRYAERRRWKSDVLASSPSELGGFKEVSLEVRGKAAFARLKHEAGVHRVQRVPVTESQGRI